MMRFNAATKDEVLVMRAQAGHQAAFNLLVERHFGSVYAAALARLMDPEEAEDLAQEVFLRAFVHLKDLRNSRYFGTWIGRITRNLANDWRRRKQTRSRVLPLLGRESRSEVEKAAGSQRGVREQLDELAEHAALTKALARLSGAERELIILRFMEGMTNREIAKQLKVHPSTIGRRMDKALSQLHEMLEPVLRRGLDPWKPSPRAVGKTLSCLAPLVAINSAARLELVASAAWQHGVAACSTATSAIPVSGSFGSLSTYLAAGGLLSMGTTKVATITAATVVIAGGIYLASPLSNAGISGTPPGSSVAVAANGPASAYALLPPLPPGFRLQVGPAQNPEFEMLRTHRQNEFQASGLSLPSAIGHAWPSHSVGRIGYASDIVTNEPVVDFHLIAPPDTSREEFQAALQTEIQRAFRVRIREERQILDVLVAAAPAGRPLYFRPPQPNTPSSFTTNRSWLSRSSTSVRNWPIDRLLGAIEGQTGVPVVDETSIQGNFDYDWQGSALDAATERFGLQLSRESREMDVLIVEPDPASGW